MEGWILYGTAALNVATCITHEPETGAVAAYEPAIVTIWSWATSRSGWVITRVV